MNPANNHPEPQPQPQPQDNLQWRIIWQEPGHPDVTELHTGLQVAYNLATTPARQEQDPVWLIPDFAYVRDMLAEEPAIQQTVASHADGRTVILSLM